MTKAIPGTPPASVGELSRVTDRITFLYLEHAIVHRDGNAITVRDERGVVHVPAATIASVMLAPGTTISHQAMMLLADSGAATVWIGEQGVRYYAHGRPLARTSRLLEAQAALVTNQSSRLRVAREMYAMRFPGEDTDGLTMQQLRGREGARVRRMYRKHADDFGVKWKSRDYRPDDFSASDELNQALSAATSCLYGVVHAVIVAARQLLGSFIRVTTGRSSSTSRTCTRWRSLCLSPSELPPRRARTSVVTSVAGCAMRCTRPS
jgi:CRISPR-associated protein Cas1